MKTSDHRIPARNSADLCAEPSVTAGCSGFRTRARVLPTVTTDGRHERTEVALKRLLVFLAILFTLPLHADSEQEWVEASTKRSFEGKLIKKTDGKEPSVTISMGKPGEAKKLVKIDPRRLSESCQKYVHKWLNYGDRASISIRHGRLYIAAKRSADPYYIEYVPAIGQPAKKFEVPEWVSEKRDPTFIVRGINPNRGTFAVKVYSAEGSCLLTLDSSDL